MSTIDQKEYLKRYLSGGDLEEKKKKKRKKKRPENAAPVKVLRSLIVDDDVDIRVHAHKAMAEDKSDLLEEPDEAPFVAEFVDERPEDEIKLEQYRKSKKWKTMGNDDITASPHSKKTSSPAQRKARHDSSPDNSPPRRRKRHDSDADFYPQRASTRPLRRQRHDSDSDFPPPRAKMNSKDRHDLDSDSDASPPRIKAGNRSIKLEKKQRHDSDSDFSPSRGKYDRLDGERDSRDGRNKPRRHDSSDSDDLSPPRRGDNARIDRRTNKGGRRHDSDSDLFPPREKSSSRTRDDRSSRNVNKSRRHNSDSDLSPPRHSKSSSNVNQKSRHDSDSDFSPARRTGRDSASTSGKSRSNKRHDSDSDLSPPRGHGSKVRGSDSDLSPLRGKRSKVKGSDSDLSPPRGKRSKARGSDSDLSPPRGKRSKLRGSDSDLSPKRSRDRGKQGKRGRMDSDSDLSPDRGKGSQKVEGLKKPTKTLSGAKAGLSDAATLRKENEATRRKTDKAYIGLADDVSGRNAETVFRDKSGKKRDLKSEKKQQREEEARKAEDDEKFMQWGKGLAQLKQRQDNLEDVLKEMAKPLARYKDDEDLDQMLKEQDREGDPMLAFMKKKESKAKALAGITEKPKYKGPKPAPNRFNIQPGYRWDGVDRSSGFEAKYFKRMADKKATSEIAYKWSIEDM